MKVGPVDKNNKLLLYKKISDGPRIDFYSIQVKTKDSYPHRGYKKRNLEFFEKDQGKLKKINYRNVKEAVSNNPQSLLALRKAEQLRSITGLIIGVSFIGPLVVSLTSAEKSNQANLVLVSPLLWTLPLSFKNIKHKQYLEAIRIYNEMGSVSSPIRE